MLSSPAQARGDPDDGPLFAVEYYASIDPADRQEAIQAVETKLRLEDRWYGSSTPPPGHQGRHIKAVVSYRILRQFDACSDRTFLAVEVQKDPPTHARGGGPKEEVYLVILGGTPVVVKDPVYSKMTAACEATRE
jgi:hypothetical protein